MTSPFVKFLKDKEKELAIVFVLEKLGGKAMATQITSYGADKKTFPTLNSSMIATKREYLIEHELLQFKEGRPTEYILTEKGRKLGMILAQLEDFIGRELGW